MTTWVERDLTTGKQAEMVADKAARLDKDVAKDLPRVQREEAKEITPVRFQPVRSPGIYDAEFGVKDRDLIFHFWPFGYHEAERKEVAPPRFPSQFEASLRAALNKTFNVDRVEYNYDGDMGAWYARAHGWGENQFAFDLAVKACKTLHSMMGGVE
jgi:hypothetical protein